VQGGAACSNACAHLCARVVSQEQKAKDAKKKMAASRVEQKELKMR
jgi:hypothetical protein